MRTTIRLDDELLKRVKTYAVQQGKSLTAVVEDALREKLFRQEAAPTREQIQLITHRGGGLQPGVDLDDSSALLDFMESYDDPA